MAYKERKSCLLPTQTAFCVGRLSRSRKHDGYTVKWRHTFFPFFPLCFFTNIVSVCVLLLCGLLVCMCVCVICDFFNGFYVLVAYLWLSASGPFVDCTCVCFIYVYVFMFVCVWVLYCTMYACSTLCCLSEILLNFFCNILI